MFLSTFNLHFFEIDASTKLDFLMQSILLWGVGNKTKSTFNLHFLHLSFSWPWISLVTFCIRATNCRLQVHWYVLPPFMSHSIFVITQIEQHDLELFKAACTFCKKKKKKVKKKRKNKKNTKGYLIMYVSSTLGQLVCCMYCTVCSLITLLK